jgi:hypothetical protein
VINFDTTHKTNLYDKPLAIFVGASHHLQNTIFGCALLGDETQDTFEWVFRAFKKCMGTNRTRCILTSKRHVRIYLCQICCLIGCYNNVNSAPEKRIVELDYVNDNV